MSAYSVHLANELKPSMGTSTINTQRLHGGQQIINYG